MERVLIEFTVFVASVATIVWVITQMLDRWVQRRRLERLWGRKWGKRPEKE